jgi:Family of unknown function (DUF6521)
MNILTAYNNFIFQAFAMSFILEESEELTLAKALLIAPIISHKGLVKYLSRKNTIVNGVEDLVIQHTQYFSNFNERFFDNLVSSMNAIQFLVDNNLIVFDNGSIKLQKTMKLTPKNSDRLRKVNLASKNISKILKSNEANLYLNLRIQL